MISWTDAGGRKKLDTNFQKLATSLTGAWTRAHSEIKDMLPNGRGFLWPRMPVPSLASAPAPAFCAGEPRWATLITQFRVMPARQAAREAWGRPAEAKKRRGHLPICHVEATEGVWVVTAHYEIRIRGRLSETLLEVWRRLA